MIPTKIKYWTVVDYVNPEANPERGYLRPKLYGIYGSETREDNEHFCFDTEKRNFILNYTTKLLFVNRGGLTSEELKDMLSKKLKEFKEGEGLKSLKSTQANSEEFVS